jgi:hypothetical protein
MNVHVTIKNTFNFIYNAKHLVSVLYEGSDHRVILLKFFSVTKTVQSSINFLMLRRKTSNKTWYLRLIKSIRYLRI